MYRIYIFAKFMGRAPNNFKPAPALLCLKNYPLGLGRNGKLIVLGIGQDPIPVMGIQIIPKRCSIVGHPSGSPRDSQVSE